MNRVRYRNESFIVERGGKPICEILPARPPKFSGADLVDLLRTLPKPDEDYLAIVEELLEAAGRERTPMATLIDSSVLIAAERGHLELDDLIARYAEADVAISAITASELLHGVQRAKTAAQRHRRQAFVEGLLAQLPVIAFDFTVARVHASLWADLAKRRALVGERDLMIGATAIASDYGIATRDERSFPKIPGLRVERL